jgi:hypothetical protein
MAVYRTFWAWLVTVIGTLGALSAYVLRPLDQFVAVGVTGLSLGACAGCLFDLRNETVTVKSMLSFGLSGSVALLALLGLGAVFGPTAVLGGLLLLALSPWALSLASRLLTGRLRTEPGNKSPGPSGSEVPAGDLDDAALLKAWRASSAALGSVGSDNDWLRLATRRQEYLAELEKRDPRGFAAWLASSPDLADDPSAFFHKS